MHNYESLARSLRKLDEKGKRPELTGHWCPYPEDSPEHPANLEKQINEKCMAKAMMLCARFPNHTMAELSNIVRVVAELCDS